MAMDSISKKFNLGQCPEDYQKLGLCHTYFFKEFNFYPSLRGIKDEYLNNISKFHDPILTYVALYLYRNYEIAYKYFKTKSGDNKPVHNSYNTACAVLNRWLDQQKSFYTDFGKCYFNRRWWDITIEPLLKNLEGYYDGKKTCERFNSYYDPSKIPYDPKKQVISYQQQSEDYVCYKDEENTSTPQGNDGNSIEENCTKLSVLFYLCNKHSLFNQETSKAQTLNEKYCPDPPSKREKIYYNSMLKAEKLCFCVPLLNKIAVPIIVTVLGTIFLAFFSNEFTPIGSILQNRSINKIKSREQFYEDSTYKEYKTYRNDNQNNAREKNIIYYQSMNK